MAIGVPVVLTSGFSLTDGTVYTTNSVSPGANRLLTLCVENGQAPGATVVGPSIVGNGLTWVEDKAQVFQFGSSRMAVYRSMGAAPSAGVITLTFSLTQRRCLWILLEETGIDTGGNQGSGAIASVPAAVLNSSGAVTSLTASLSAFASADNMAIGFFAARRNAALSIAPGAGFTELVEVDSGLDAEGAGHILMAEYKLNDPSVDATYSASVQQNWAAAIALEIKAAAGAPQGGGGGTPAPGARDPRDWPFDSSSSWNHPIGTGAVYETIVGGSNLTNAYFNASQFTIAVWKASVSDPLLNVTVTNQAMLDPLLCTLQPVPSIQQIRIPSNAVPSPPAWSVGGDAAMAVCDPDLRYVYEFHGARKDANGVDWRTYNFVKTDLQGLGADFSCQRATRASGTSYLGGTVRAGELLNGIKHALGIAIAGPRFNKNAPGGKSYVRPASGSDDPSRYGTTGNLYMGSLLAIPASVDVEALPYTSTGDALTKIKNLARALRLYGALIIDGHGSGSNTVIFGMEYNARSEVSLQETNTQFANDLDMIVTYLKTVSNNGPGSIGGGGTPLTTLAPPFSTGTSTVPNAPIDLQATAVGGTTIDVSMTNQDVAPNLATSTEWWWKQKDETVYTKITLRPAGESTFQFTGLPSSKEIHIQAYKGNDVGLSNPAAVLGGGTFLIATTTPTPTPLPAPSSVTAEPVAYNKGRVSFSAVVGAASYRLEVSKNNGVPTLLEATLAYGSVPYTHTDADAGSGGSSYKYRVQANGATAAEDSAFAESNEITLPSLSAPITLQTNFGPSHAAEWSKPVFTDDEAIRLIKMDDPFSPLPFKNESVMRLTVSSLSAAKEGYLVHSLSSVTEKWMFDVFALPTGFAGPAGDYFTFLQLHDSVNNKILAALRINGTGNVLQLNSEATGDTFPKTIISAVTTNLLHAVQVRVKTGASGQIDVFYDDTLLVSLAGLTMTGWNANQIRFLGVRVPASWSGVFLARHPGTSDSSPNVKPITQASAFPSGPANWGTAV